MTRHKAQKVLIYCQDSLGLGHLRRNINIAYELSRQAPGTEILFLADSPRAPFFKLPPNSDFIKLPTVVKVDSGVWQAHKLPRVAIERTWRLRSEMIRDVAFHFQPNVFLVDHMPQGASRELLPCLQMLRADFPQTHTVVGLRDILGAPEVIMRQWRREEAYDVINQFYDSVLVYGTPELYDLTKAYQFPAEVRQKVTFCGYVAPNLDTMAPLHKPLTAYFAEPKPYTLLVMGGGGSDAHYFMDHYLEALRLLAPDIPFNTLVVTGPFMPEADRDGLRQKAEGLPVVVKQMENDSLRYIEEADMVVCMAGYNTTCEILRLQQKAILVPRSGPSAEQGMRCEILHERGLIYSLHPRDLTAGRLAEVMMQELVVNKRPFLPYPSMNGAEEAARYMLSMINCYSCV